MQAPKRVLPVMVLSQFLCTTLWFGGNAVLGDLSRELHLPSTALGSVTSAVQLGFISGTLVYALLTIADRFMPASVFFTSAVIASVANAAIVFTNDFTVILVLRCCTGFFLAGIYPVGMKIAADHFDKGLGKALGYLVGALVLGTAFPHLLKSLSVAFSWKAVLMTISVLALSGGVLMWMLVPRRRSSTAVQRPDLTLALKVFRPKPFRAAAFGYFGHMWELYTFWAFLPVIIQTYTVHHGGSIPVSMLAFTVIAVGALACIAGGYVSQKIGAKRTAFIALACSGCCCVLSPFIFQWPPVPFVVFLLFWGWMVIADSPMFSTLVAQNAAPSQKGTALTIVTCIGFFITIISIETLNRLNGRIDPTLLCLFLAPGPVLGLIGLKAGQVRATPRVST